MSDMLKIGTSGVLAQRALLQTTSNNISNVSTAAYSRQRSIIYTNILDQGCGAISTTRVINQYAERELLRDNGSVGYYEAYNEGLDSVDKLLSGDDTGLNSVITDVFGAIQSANNSPTDLASRSNLLGTLQTYTDRVNNLGMEIQNQYLTANKKIVESVSKVNELLQGIYKSNAQIVEASTDVNSAAYLQMQDQRDALITELSSIIDIKTVDQPNGSCYVNLASGPTLVLGDGCATLSAEASSLDENDYQLKLTYNEDNGYTMLSNDVGGKLGGYFDAANALKDVQREFGKINLTIADRLNKQNKSGITLENLAGSELFKIDDVKASSNSKTGTLTMSFVEGSSDKITGNDYKLVVNSDGSTTLFEKQDGSFKEVEFEDGETTESKLGFSLKTDGTLTPGDEFLIQPTLNFSYNLELAINKPEDFAFTSMVRASADNQNLGNATIKINGVTNTDANSVFSLTSGKEVTENSLNENAPAKVVINKDGNYEVYDKGNNLLGTTLAKTKGENILANMLSDVSDETSLVYDPGNKDKPAKPDFDFNITGTVAKGDEFTIAINTDGFADNSNGLMMQNLEQTQIVDGKHTANASYSNMVSDLGSKLSAANVNLNAATAKRDQTMTITEEASGVDLNEEASNLVRYQQCYTACARIISASQTVFDSLLSALG